MAGIERALGRARGQKTPPASGASARTGSRGLVFSAMRRVNTDPDVLRRNRVIATSGTSGGSEAFKMLRTRVRRAMEAQKLTTLAVSSPAMNEGKTLVATNLAFRMAAEASSEVILADFDLRHPSVSGLLELDSSLPGLHNYLRDEASLQEVCVSPGPDRLAVLPNNRASENSSEILRSAKMAELVAELRTGGPTRMVIFDMPPLLYADDFLAFAPHVDGLLLVVCEGKTKRVELAEAYDMLSGVNVIGTVLNKSVGRTEAYYY